MRLAFVVLLAACCAWAADPRWSLQTESGDGSLVEPESCHALDQFPGERKELGIIAGRRIIQTIAKEGSLAIKSLLVERSAAQYCMIYRQRYEQDRVIPKDALLLRVGDQTVLATRDRARRADGVLIEHYWSFEPAGPIHIDLGVLYTYARELLPAGHDFYEGYSRGVNLEKRCFIIEVRRDQDRASFTGYIGLKLAISGHRIKVIEGKFHSRMSISCDGISPTIDSRWSLLSVNGKGANLDGPSCHTLAYFSGSPLRFDFERWFFGINDPAALKTETEQRTIGVIAGRRIVQVIQRINGNEAVMKRLLVQRSPRSYCMIYQQQYSPSTVHAGDAYILTFGDQSLLATRDRVDGTGNYYLEHYWSFDAAGPVELDLNVIRQHTKTLLPPGHSIWKGYGLDMKNLCYAMPVWKDTDANCCGTGGEVALKLAIVNHRLKVVDSKYSADGGARCSDLRGAGPGYVAPRDN